MRRRSNERTKIPKESEQSTEFPQPVLEWGGAKRFLRKPLHEYDLSA